MEIRENTIKATPKDVFMHLLGFGALYISIVSFITLLFQYINVLFPDQLSFYFGSILNQIRWSTSTLVILFPVFILISWLSEKDFVKIPGKRDIKFRKWLIYFTLFVAAVTIIIDLITLVFNFYSGELTTQFFLKVLVILTIAAGVFGYYFWDLKRKPGNRSKKPKTIAWTVSIVILISVVAGFFIVGSPATQRLRKFDEQRISNLQVLQGEIVSYWIQKDELPATLDDLTNSITGFIPPKDPETDEPYKYIATSDLSFELCGVFKTKSIGNTPNARFDFPRSKDLFMQNWSHDMGSVCFERTIDPELYNKEGMERIPKPERVF